MPPHLHEDDCVLGSIAYSNDHMDYVAEVFTAHDRTHAPEKSDYAFGQPVYVRTAVDGDTYAVVGVVYNTQLVDPNQGRSGPRLSSERQEMFTPGYVEEKMTLIGIALLGYVPITSHEQGGFEMGSPIQEMPPWTLDIDAHVCKLSDEGVRAFHDLTGDGSVTLAYYQRLLAVADDFGAAVTLALLGRLRQLLPADAAETAAVLDVIERNIRWQSMQDQGVVR